MPSRGARLVLDKSGRKLAGSRLRVVAAGQPVAARFEVDITAVPEPVNTALGMLGAIFLLVQAGRAVDAKQFR
ncbi:MAG: hypothetical protein HZA90_05055 [Verrucomicrobia bacterium]|nr:hypothetical protein [Verrucomicrobiota bacterium]